MVCSGTNYIGFIDKLNDELFLWPLYSELTMTEGKHYKELMFSSMNVTFIWRSWIHGWDRRIICLWGFFFWHGIKLNLEMLHLLISYASNCFKCILNHICILNKAPNRGLLILLFPWICEILRVGCKKQLNCFIFYRKSFQLPSIGYTSFHETNKFL